jgi:hypothetical protein
LSRRLRSMRLKTATFTTSTPRRRAGRHW